MRTLVAALILASIPAVAEAQKYHRRYPLPYQYYLPPPTSLPQPVPIYQHQVPEIQAMRRHAFSQPTYGYYGGYAPTGIYGRGRVFGQADTLGNSTFYYFSDGTYGSSDTVGGSTFYYFNTP